MVGIPAEEGINDARLVSDRRWFLDGNRWEVIIGTETDFDFQHLRLLPVEAVANDDLYSYSFFLGYLYNFGSPRVTQFCRPERLTLLDIDQTDLDMVVGQHLSLLEYS